MPGGGYAACLGGCPADVAQGCLFGRRWARLRVRYPGFSDGELLAVRLRALGVPRRLGDDW